MTKWGAFLVVLFVFAMLMLTVGMLVQIGNVSKKNQPEEKMNIFLDQSNKDYNIVGCRIGWDNNHNRWMQVTGSGEGMVYLDPLPAEIENSFCKMCAFWMKAKLDKRATRSVPPNMYVLEVLKVKRLPCDH